MRLLYIIIRFFTTKIVLVIFNFFSYHMLKSGENRSFAHKRTVFLYADEPDFE